MVSKTWMLCEFLLAFFLGLSLWASCFLLRLFNYFYVSTVFALLLIAMIVVFWAATGFAHLGFLRELKDDMRKRIVLLLTYVILGTSSVLLITVYNFVHPLNAHRIYLSSHSPIFFFEGGPLMLFLFTWGCSVSLLALGFIGLTAREKRLEDHFLCGKYLGEFGMVLCVVGMLLPISTAVFSHFFRFPESVPSGPREFGCFHICLTESFYSV